MKENIVDLVDVSIVDGQIVVTPKNGVYVQLVDKAIDDDWADNFGDIPQSNLKPFSDIFFDARIAIARLRKLMAQPCVNGDWKPILDGLNGFWVILYSVSNGFYVIENCEDCFFLAFKDKPTAEKFLQKYRSYIEQAAPILFGVEL